MHKVKLMTVFGTRPEAIKMAPLILELKKHDSFETIVCVTGQHREMLDQVLGIFGIDVDFDLNIMQEKQSLTDITVNAIKGMEGVFSKVTPELVLVHGDTTTTFAASLAAFYHKIKVAHVEAGLRTHDKWFPFPEEMNRKLTGDLADIHFAPTAGAKQNLIAEGVAADNIFVTGNTVIDVLPYTIKEDYYFKTVALNEIDYDKMRIVVVEAHRRENWGRPMENICRAIKRLLREYSDMVVVYPVHLNPAVRDTVLSMLDGLDRCVLVDPLDIDDMHNLLYRSYMVLTDSGGLQEEVPSMGKPVLVLRRETERPEAVEAGTVKLVGLEEKDIYREASLLLSDAREYLAMANSVNPYGDGQASKRISGYLLNYYGFSKAKPEEFNR
ncbi:non-hydrolyzing UDP-N-acetylglucosamine 2-epimerase [Calorimonas adulescens]|uniref:UDP-N-acetylglucosamine 2-epimerase (non-hydrolyzing) n=1 Tax=Calorimonas adulescens TaxID=2606906 RepID=A0A5D8QCP8_9THEO|nr:UDP-N-acetylglucosamine 2-epimerase (non-hydrolyzing) [Calorimonas adulescens]TZE81303.1 UDP-N-acetylglucosamine 2-epimerase (non-hydrolyzing) [Calorimonas adulescens]